MSDSPKISIILPTFNRADKIKNAVRSVQNQTYKDWELIIVDDASSDNTSEVLEKLAAEDLRIRTIRNEENLGLAKTPNKALAIARGEFIARIDDDDEWIDANKLQKQIDYFKSHPNCVLLGTAFRVVDISRKPIRVFAPPETDADIRKVILSENIFGHSTVLFRRDVAVELGGYDESLGYTEDYDLWLRLGQKGEFANLSDITVEYVESKIGMSYANRKRQLYYRYHLIKKYAASYPNAFSARLRLLGSFVLSYMPLLRIFYRKGDA